MNAIVVIILGLASFFILAMVVWRFSSCRFSLPCPVWLRWFVEQENPFAKTNRSAVIIEHLELEPGMKVIDIGCGPGRVTIPVAKKVGQKGVVTALDVQSGMLKCVQVKAEKVGLKNIEYLNSNIEDGKLGKGQYDRALLINVLGEIPNQEVAMKSIFEALKPGGILLVTEVIFDPHFQSQKTVSELAKKSGFILKKKFGNRIAFSMQLKKPLG